MARIKKNYSFIWHSMAKRREIDVSDGVNFWIEEATTDGMLC